MRSFFQVNRVLFFNFVRNHQDVFFSLLFPLIFLLIFGFIFGDQEYGERQVSIGYFVEGEEDLKRMNSIIDDNPVLNRILVADMENVKTAVEKREVHMGMVLKGETLDFYFNPTRVEDNPFFRQMARGIAAAWEREGANFSPIIKVEKVGVAQREYTSQLEYMMPGVISIAIISSGLFAISASFLHFRESGVLKRLAATPLRKEVFMTGIILTRILASLAGTAIVLFSGRLIFGLEYHINWLEFLPFLIVATLAMMALGVVVALIFKKADNASQFSALLVTIMIFFSGICVPLELTPQFVQSLSSFLPLTYVAAGLRHAMQVELMSYSDFIWHIIIMLSFSIVLLGFLSRLISWEKQ